MRYEGAVYNPPLNTSLPLVAVILCDGKVVAAHAVESQEDGTGFIEHMLTGIQKLGRKGAGA